MGWFKRIFKIGEAAETEEASEASVDLTNLPAWVNSKLDDEFSKIKPAIEEEFEKIIEQKHSITHELEDLKVAELHNPDIPEREKQIMEGNRASYISQHKQFLNMINISDNISCDETVKFSRNFEDLLMKLAQSTAKGHAVMNAFFADHASKINKSVKLMSDANSRIQETLTDANLSIEDVDEIHKSIIDLKSKKKMLADVNYELEMLTKKLSNSNFLKDKLMKQVEQLKQSAEYSEFDSASRERDELSKRAKSAEEELSMLFSPLHKPMKRYERMIAEDSALFTRYIDNSISALSDDEQLKILNILQKMKKSLEDGALDVKDSDKAIKRVDEIGRDKLIEIRARYTEARKSIKAIESQMRNSKVMVELNDLQYKAEHTESQIKLLSEKMDKAKSLKEKTDLAKLQEEVAGRIKEAFNVEVNITWQDSHTASSSLSSE
jgi:hypothetical protein